jgi:hypothetical protein
VIILSTVKLVYGQANQLNVYFLSQLFPATTQPARNENPVFNSHSYLEEAYVEEMKGDYFQ